MKFQKGHKINNGRIPWNKGRKGVQVGANKGRKFLYKERPNAKGRLVWNKGLRGLVSKLKGRPNYASRGANSNFWKGGITPINFSIRNSLEYKLWRTAVFTRDNYTCRFCGARNGNGKAIILQADHIKPFAHYPELRFIINNGRTLCVDCHKKTSTYGNRNEVLTI